MHLCGLKAKYILKKLTPNIWPVFMYDENIDENVYLSLCFRKGVSCKRARPKLGPVTIKGLKTPELELLAFSKDPAI